MSTVSEDAMYFYIMQGDSDARCYVQRKFAAIASDEPIDFKLPETVIIGLCDELLKRDKELDKYKDALQNTSDGFYQILKENKILKEMKFNVGELLSAVTEAHKADALFELKHDYEALNQLYVEYLLTEKTAECKRLEKDKAELAKALAYTAKAFTDNYAIDWDEIEALASKHIKQD